MSDAGDFRRLAVPETNPFRRSMILREISPSTIGRSPSPGQIPTPPPRQESQVANLDYAGHSVPPRQSSNPFQIELDSAGDSEEALEPPPSYDQVAPPASQRRHSDGDEKARLARREQRQRERERDREGYYRERERRYREREAREREREREREQRDREAGHDSKRAGLASTSSNRTRSPRRRSKSEAAHLSASSSRKMKKANQASLDVIDKMDVTGLFGPGSFHHDGPFDALTPARNSKKNLRKRVGPPPITAFLADGPNNSLRVDPAMGRYQTQEQVYGRGAQLAEQTVPPEAAQMSFDPTDKTERVHGMVTAGLGSSTFLDGTRASRDDIEEAGREKTEQLGRSRSILRRQRSQRQRPVAHRGNSDSALPDEDDAKPTGGLLGRVRSLRVSRR